MSDIETVEVQKIQHLQAGDYLVLLAKEQVSHAEVERWLRVADDLGSRGIFLHFVKCLRPESVRFLRAESPETVRVEEAE